MTPEAPQINEEESILLAIKNLYANSPDKSDDNAIEQWGQTVELKTNRALELGLSRIDIEYAKLQGMKPEDREYYITALADDIETYIENGEIPYINKRELKNLKRRAKTLNKRTSL